MTDMARQWAEAAIAAGRYGIGGTRIDVSYEHLREALTCAISAALRDQRVETDLEIQRWIHVRDSW